MVTPWPLETFENWAQAMVGFTYCTSSRIVSKAQRVWSWTTAALVYIFLLHTGRKPFDQLGEI